jgi:hypothetical protein
MQRGNSGFLEIFDELEAGNDNKIRNMRSNRGLEFKGE